MTEALIGGFFTGLSLILAIGAQNAFVLRQGLRGEHVLAVVLICALSDALLITLGVTGFTALSKEIPWLSEAMRWGGILFLVTYGALRFKAAWRGGEALMPAPDQSTPLRTVILTGLLFTWGNPHVYLDTVVLIGSVSSHYHPNQFHFGLGAAFASIFFFSALGFGARALRPFFAKPRTWVWLEICVGIVMWMIAAGLVFGR